MRFLAHAHVGAGSDVGTHIATAVLVLHVVAAATWLAGVIAVLARRVIAGRVVPMLTVAAVTTIVSGAVNARIHIEAPTLLTHRAYGWVFLSKLALVVAAVLLGWRVRHSGRALFVPLEATALSLAAAAGVALALLPGLTSALPALHVVAAPTDDPECVSQIEGAFAAVHEQRPSSTLTFLDPSRPVPTDAVRAPACLHNTDVRATASWLRTFLARRGNQQPVVIIDDDPRGAQLATALAASAATADHVPSAADAVVVATSWQHAAATLDAVRRPLRTVILAPWLLRRTLLAPAATDTGAGQLTVATDLDPTGVTGASYVDALARIDHTLEPTAAGLQGYRAMRTSLLLGVSAVGRPKLLAPARISFLPTELDAGHGHTSTSGWLPIGDLAPLT